MATETKDQVETSEEQATVKIMFNGQEIEIPGDSRLVAQLHNVTEKQLSARYQEDRDNFVKSIKTPINKAMDGFDEALDGMTLVYNLDNDEARIVESSKVKVSIRGVKGSQ